MLTHARRLGLLPFFVLGLVVCNPAANGSSDTGNDDDDQQSGSNAVTNKGTNKSSSGADDDDGDDEDDEDGNASPTAGTPPNTGCASAPFAEKQLRDDITFLASEKLAGRAPGTPGDQAARSFIEARFKCLGVAPGGDGGTSYFQTFKDTEGHASANVVGMIAGTDPTVGKDIIIVSAHIDHFGTVGGEGMRLGANDNASGIASVLAVAAAAKQSPPKRTIAFMVFGSEELGCEGSHHYLDASLTGLPTDRVVYDVNFDMVGTYSQNGNKVLAHGTKPKTPGAAVIKSALKAANGLVVEVGVDGLGEDDSDYSPFCFAGIPVVAFFTDDPPCYHKACDTADRIDYPHLSQITKLGSDVVMGLANGATDLAAARRNLKVGDLGCGSDDDD